MAKKTGVRTALDNAVAKAGGSTPEKPDRHQQYLGCISAYEREFERWEKRTKKIIERYRDENRPPRSNNESRFNILWSNVQTLVPACFSKLPQPDVSRRFRDQDQVCLLYTSDAADE